MSFQRVLVVASLLASCAGPPGSGCDDPAVQEPQDEFPKPTGRGCGVGEAVCGGQCVDLETSAQHCGACYAACAGTCERRWCTPAAYDGGDCGADLGTSANCGRCGRSCGTAACHGSGEGAYCDAEEVGWVPNSQGIGHTGAVLDETHAFFLVGSQLYRVPREGGTPQVLENGRAGRALSLALDATYVYAATLAGGLWRVRKDLVVDAEINVPDAEVVDPGVCPPQEACGGSLAMDAEGGLVYFLAYNATARSFDLKRVATSGGPVTVVRQVDATYGSTLFPLLYAAHHLYFNDASGVNRVADDGTGDPEGIHGGRCWDMASDGERLFLIDSNGAIFRQTLGGTDEVLLVPNQVTGMGVWGGTLFYQHGQALQALVPDGSAPLTLHPALRMDSVNPAGDHVYFMTASTEHNGAVALARVRR